MACCVGDYKGSSLSGDIGKDSALFKEIFKNDDVFRCRSIRPFGSQVSFFVMFIDGMIDCQVLSDNVIKPLTLLRETGKGELTTHYIGERVIFSGEAAYEKDVSKILEAVMTGDTAVLIQDSPTALVINTKGFVTRSVEEPVDERVTQGPREGFLETAMLNLSMIRRRLLTPDLHIKTVRIGKRSNTAAFICYLDSLTDKKIISELKRRLGAIDIDGVLDSNYLTEYIRDRKMSVFKTVGTTERPDVVAARLLEGRIAVVVDGSPMVLTLPYLFSENFQSDEDYYVSYIVSSVRRLLRYVCFIASVSVPALFIALSTFHIELMPTHFAVSVAQLRMGVPISSVGECLLLVVVFEVLKEAGVRMSQSLGHALSIVGGLVVGEAAVQAKIISAPMLIAVAFSGICGLMVPRLKASVLYIRITSVIICAFLGLYGFMALGCAVLIHVLSIKSFGVDYTVSLTDISFQSLKDTVFRAPWTKMIRRPLFSKDSRRSGGENNKMKRILSAILLPVLFVFLAGCQGYREIDSEYLISAIGFESERGEYKVYSEVLELSGEKKDAKSELFYAKGKTPYEAVSNIAANMPEKAVFDHCSTALIQSGTGGGEFKKIIKYLYDTKNLNLGICLYCADDIKEILSLDSQSLSVGYDVSAIKNNIEKTTGTDFENKYYEICSLQMSDKSFCLPKITAKEKRPLISAQTVYADFIPVYELESEETVLYNLLRGGSKGGEISVSGERLRANRIRTEIRIQDGGLFAKIHCDYRKKGDKINGVLKSEAQKLLHKLNGTKALMPLAAGAGGKADKVEVSVYG